MSSTVISNIENLETLPQLNFIELEAGVFEKPAKLGDILYSAAGKRKIVACDNANDIRFVESVMKRKGIAIRRISPLINPSEINSVASWIQSKYTKDAHGVCFVSWSNKVHRPFLFNKL